MNCYVSLDDLKAHLEISGTARDTLLTLKIEAASRLIDMFCGRHFYCKAETLGKYYDVYGTVSVQDMFLDKTRIVDKKGKIHLYIDDLLPTAVAASTQIKMDINHNNTYQATLSATDYVLYPPNSYPKTKLVLDEKTGAYSVLYGGQKMIQIVEVAPKTGIWGYGDGESAKPYAISGIKVTIDSTTITTIALTDEGTIEVGHTILVGSEQMYISAVTSDDTNEATAIRGVNGTAAAKHSTATDSYIYKYPLGIVEACLFISARLCEFKESGYKSERLGDYSYTRMDLPAGLTETEKAMLYPYKKYFI